MKKFLYVIYIFLVINNSYAQFFKGKIIANYPDLEGITIINSSQKVAVTSQKNGFFTIKATVKDTLTISAIQFIGKTIVLKSEDFDQDRFFIKLNLQTNYIEEVEVVKEKNGYDSGILNKKAKTFTPAERKLNTASNMYPNVMIGNMSGVSLGLDPILNWISGRTKQLKQNVRIEQKELAIKKINSLFEAVYFTQTLKIPDEQVSGFMYYIVENSDFLKALDSKNKLMIKFLLTDLSKNYLILKN